MAAQGLCLLPCPGRSFPYQVLLFMRVPGGPGGAQRLLWSCKSQLLQAGKKQL